MKIIINSSSMVPIYEQIMDQIKSLITGGDLKQNDALPSVRTLAKELKISALTVTIHGKGTYVAASNKERILEELKREIESDLEKVVQKARGCGLDDSQIREMLELIMED